MAREGRGRRDDEGAGGGRGARIPQGPSFAMAVGLGAGLAAAVLAFLGAFVVGAATTGDPGEAIDVGGVQAARMLAAPGSERWKAGFGSGAAVRAKAKEWLDTELAKRKDDREKTAATKAVDEFKAGKNVSGVDWKPGFDLIFPPSDPNDDLIDAARRDSLKKAAEGVKETLVGAAIRDAGGQILVPYGQIYTPSTAPSKRVGDTSIYVLKLDGGISARQYEHPIRSRSGSVDGSAVVVLSAAGVKEPAPIAAAGAAAGAAFIGGFLVGLMLALAPVKAIRKLATDAEAIANGDLSARVSVSGPDVVQAAAKNVQRIAQLAASSAGMAAAEPQIIEQQVMVQPVAEVLEGLAPTKSFRRPDEFEIESTAKPCPELGNDYFDVVNVDAGSVGILVADIPNMRGVRGAMLMAQVRALFRAAAPGEKSPAEVLKKVNRAFAADLPRGTYVTAMYAVIDQATGICKVASAQHLPLVVWKSSVKKSAKVAPEGIALGLDAGAVFDKTIVEKAIQLERGDRIVLYTDGAISARNTSGAEYGDERFYYVLNREAPKNSAACVNFVANDVDLFHEGAPQTDDFTIVTLRKMK